MYEIRGLGSMTKSLLSELTGLQGDIRWDPTKLNGQPRRGLDTEKARAAFSFETNTPLQQGIHNVAKWFERTPNSKYEMAQPCACTSRTW